MEFIYSEVSVYYWRMTISKIEKCKKWYNISELTVFLIGFTNRGLWSVQ
jgi:hypothetical protein